ncbi:3-methylornithyl-N6-L-lysine dehydrogenase PylD [Desulfospira joergensenii]|uniref:3-methylornithyl-N6-L-lysine dehydrogenase PylD n=1 Tax=Desulfospira joergensenii TaxID=53329 RepID=UPI0003B3E2B3|nr:3-methylornithyl-N6-L-lysine dehydrogenase PylD [Desulfospira joergensenii]
MTRLKESDISHISSNLPAYDRELSAKTGKTLLGIACHACRADEMKIREQAGTFSIQVVPVTAGQGIIGDFSQTVAAILHFMGFKARVSDRPDISGIAAAFEQGADAVMTADDHRFVGINLQTRTVSDNSRATGRVFAGGLDLMARGIKDKEVLVMGCGPVGEAAAKTLLSLGARVGLYDLDPSAAHASRQRLSDGAGRGTSMVEENLDRALLGYSHILEATPAEESLPLESISDQMLVAAPGVPLGVPAKGCEILGDRLLHDTLELGVAAMAVSLLL